MNASNQNPDDGTQARTRTRSQRWLIAGLIVAGAAFGGSQLAGAVQHATGHHAMGQHAAVDPAEMDRHAAAMADRVLANGTPEQKARLVSIMRSAHAEIAPMHQQLGQAHERARTLLMQPRVDRAALETLRAEQVRQIDAASRRFVQAMGDAADMLTPEQRAMLFDHMQAQNH